MRLLAIDPGRTTGWAYFFDGQLQKAWACSQEEALVAQLHVSDVLIEKPCWYGKDNKVDANDLISLGVFVGQLKQLYESRDAMVGLVLPVTWKGTVPKKIHNERVLDALTSEERLRLPFRLRAKDYDHNMLDAVGLGLWKLRRLG